MRKTEAILAFKDLCSHETDHLEVLSGFFADLQVGNSADANTEVYLRALAAIRSWWSQAAYTPELLSGMLAVLAREQVAGAVEASQAEVIDSLINVIVADRKAHHELDKKRSTASFSKKVLPAMGLAVTMTGGSALPLLAFGWLAFKSMQGSDQGIDFKDAKELNEFLCTIVGGAAYAVGFWEDRPEAERIRAGVQRIEERWQTVAAVEVVPD